MSKLGDDMEVFCWDLIELLLPVEELLERDDSLEDRQGISPVKGFSA